MASFQTRIMAGVLPFLLAAPGVALAQMQPSQYSTTSITRTTTADVVYTRQQVDQLIAPIALYPDPLLTHVLMASAYPQQIIEASQWLQDPAHAALHGDALIAALRPLPWAPSVKALVAVPQVIVTLSEHIEWTQALGVAVVTQEKVVLTQVQALRRLAVRSGRLHRVRDIRVLERGDVIIITSAEPDRVVVPVYNPVVVYAAWPAPEYPPVFLPPPPTLRYEMVERGFGVSVGYPVAAPLWTWSRPDWRNQTITINRNEVTRIAQNIEIGPGDVWRHEGPVVLAAPLSVQRGRTHAASGPAGTIAPVGAAAVAVLPERAQHLPNLIEMPKAASRPGVENRAANQATGGQSFGTRNGAQQPMTGQSAPSTAPFSQNGNQATTNEPTQGGVTAGGGTSAEHNRNEATTNEPTRRQSGMTAGGGTSAEHNRNEATTNERSRRQGGMTTGAGSASENSRSQARTNEPMQPQSGATAGARGSAEHNRSQTTRESTGQYGATSADSAYRSQRHHHRATTNEPTVQQGGSGMSSENNRGEAATTAPSGQSSDTGPATATPSEHHRRQAITSAPAQQDGTVTGEAAGSSEHHRGQAATSEPTGPNGGMATGSEHHRHRTTASEPGGMQSGSPGGGSTGAVTTPHESGHSPSRQEITGEGASGPGASASHGDSASSMHRSPDAAGAGGSEPTGGAATSGQVGH